MTIMTVPPDQMPVNQVQFLELRERVSVLEERLAELREDLRQDLYLEWYLREENPPKRRWWSRLWRDLMDALDDPNPGYMP